MNWLNMSNWSWKCISPVKFRAMLIYLFTTCRLSNFLINCRYILFYPVLMACWELRWSPLKNSSIREFKQLVQKQTLNSIFEQRVREMALLTNCSTLIGLGYRYKQDCNIVYKILVLYFLNLVQYLQFKAILKQNLWAVNCNIVLCTKVLSDDEPCLRNCTNFNFIFKQSRC